MSSKYVNERDRTLYSANFDLLNGIELTEKGYPIIKPVEEIPKIDELIEFNRMLTDERPGNHGVHFFIDDYQFERVWNKPWVYLEKLREYKLIIQPDFSTYTDYPLPLQQYHHYKNQLLGAFYQSQGLTMIPAPGWSDERSFEWTLDGQPENSWVAISTVGVTRYADARVQFVRGVRRFFEAKHPKGVVVYGRITPEIKNIFERAGIPYIVYRQGQTVRAEKRRK